MTMSSRDLSAVKSKAIFEIRKVADEIIRPHMSLDGGLPGYDTRPQHSSFYPPVTRDEVDAFFKRLRGLSSEEAVLQQTLLLWASNYDQNVVVRVLQENRLFDDAEIRTTFDGLQKDISAAGRSLIERIKLSRIALTVPGNPSDHAFDFGWPFLHWISSLYDQLKPILSWSQIDERLVFLYMTLIDATYKMHRVFEGKPLDLADMPSGFDSEAIPSFSSQESEPKSLRGILELLVQLAVGMEAVLDQIEAVKSPVKIQTPVFDDKFCGNERPELNDTEFQVLHALYRIGQPQAVGFVRNEVNRPGTALDQTTVSKICSKLKSEKLGFALLLHGKRWHISAAGAAFVESDARYRKT